MAYKFYKEHSRGTKGDLDKQSWYMAQFHSKQYFHKTSKRDSN